jgi:serine/threonine protein kinase
VPSQPQAGSIGPYRIVRPLGAGGWANVYEVETADGRRFALKRLSAELTPATQARFRREVESLRRIAHPGVLHLIDAGVDGATPYLVTPLVSGTSLRELLLRGPVGVEAAIAIVAAAADAVAAIHAVGLVHRDLKPEHLMVTPAGDVIVIDLGLAIGPEHSRHTAEDALTGSVPYMAPEQIDDRAPSPASDVWALGVVLYEAIAGRRPFERSRQSEEVAAILAGRCAALDEIAPTCPMALAKLVGDCLAAAPAQRPADGAALAAALVSLIDWTSPARLAEERARLLADRDGYLAQIRTTRVALVVQSAERALAAGDRFAATREVERGLAYAPDAPQLRALVEKLMSGPVNGRQTVKGHAPAKMPIGGFAPAPGIGSGPGIGPRSEPAAPSHPPSPLSHSPSPPSQLPFPSPSPSPSRSRSRSRWIWIAVVLAVVIAVAIVAAVVGTGDGDGATGNRQQATGDRQRGEGEGNGVRGEGEGNGVRGEGPVGEGAFVDRTVEARPSHVQSSKPAHVKPSSPAPGRPPIAP